MTVRAILDALQRYNALNKDMLKFDENGNLLVSDEVIELLSNALASKSIDALLVDIHGDNVGLAKEDTLSKLIGSLKSVDTDKLLIAVSEDDVGLAKDTSILNSKRLYPDTLYRGEIDLTNSGTAATELSVLSTPLTIPSNGEYVVELAISVSTTVKLSVTVGTKTYSYYLNAGNALAANSWYAFSVYLSENDQINLEVDVPAGTTVTGVLWVYAT